MILQACKFPEQIRLSQWKFDLNQINKDIVLNFINSESQIKHLLVFGNTGSGKTTLSIGMATELAIKRFSCTYTTAMKISALFYKENQFELTDYFWDWRNSNCLIIDDFNPTNPIIEQIITPELFLNYIQNDGNDSVNKSILINKKVIWLIGKNDCQDNWIALLLKLGVKKSEMNLIDLRN
jgi:Holliday junction resolvasome RuvABC ATP-dependent DNA helicase subunit